MLVDSSVWIAYLRGDNLVEVALLSEALERGEPVWLAPRILQEVLQGADSPDRFTRWDRVLGELPESKKSHAAEELKAAEDRDIQRAIRLSEEEERRRKEAVDSTNAAALFDEQGQL